MKHARWIVWALLMGLALPVAAGDEEQCTMQTQDCLDKMAAKLKDRGWVGIEMDRDEYGGALMITRVVPGSPAEASGLQVGDTLVAVNGVRFADNTKDKCVTCEAMEGNWKPGSKVRYLVGRGDEKVKVELTLARIPTHVMAQWVGQHMLEHASVEVAKK